MFKPKYIICIFFLITLYLSLHRLDNLYFWDDEAECGIISRNFLTTGHLTAWDGRNLYAFRNGASLDNHLRDINPPMNFWVCAASFKLFGVSTWSGRFPFVICGLIALAVFILLVKNDFGNDPWLLFYTIGVFALSPVFLLNIRQCRYYSLSMFFALLGYYAWRKCLSTKRLSYFLILSLSAILSFYANFMLCFAFILTLGILHLFFHRRDFSKRDWLFMGTTVLLFLVSTVPYALYYQIWVRPDFYQYVPENPVVRHLNLMRWNLRDLNHMTAMPWTIFIGLLFLYFRYRKDYPQLKIALEWGTFAILNVIFIALISPQSTVSPGLADIRYLIVSIPFLFGLIGFFLWFVNRWSRWVTLCLFAVIINSNLLTLFPGNTEFRWLLPGYLYEIHHDYPSFNSLVSNYLETHAQQDDTVMCLSDNFTYPIMFYEGHKVKFCCMLDPETHLPYGLIESLNAPLFIQDNFPDWVILFGTHWSYQDKLRFFSRPHEENGIMVQYSYQLVDVLNVYWRDTTRPEMFLHRFSLITDFDRKTEAVYIIRRRVASVK